MGQCSHNHQINSHHTLKLYYIWLSCIGHTIYTSGYHTLHISMYENNQKNTRTRKMPSHKSKSSKKRKLAKINKTLFFYYFLGMKENQCLKRFRLLLREIYIELADVGIYLYGGFCCTYTRRFTICFSIYFPNNFLSHQRKKLFMFLGLYLFIRIFSYSSSSYHPM